MSVSPGARFVVASVLDQGADDYRTMIFDVSRRAEVTPSRDISRLTTRQFSADSRFFAVASDTGQVHVWRTSDWSSVPTVNHGNGVRDIAFATDGTHMATGGDDGVVRIWSMPEGVEIWRRRHSSRVNDVTFSLDGVYVASAGADKIVWVRRWQPDYLTRAACSRLDRDLAAEEWKQYIKR